MKNLWKTALGNHIQLEYLEPQPAILREEVGDAPRNLKTHKSPGADNTVTEMLEAIGH